MSVKRKKYAAYTAEDRNAIKDFLTSRLNGAEKALTSLREDARANPDGWSAENVKYWKNVASFARQCLAQLPQTVKRERQVDDAPST